jgi:hypothetical protein
MERERHIWQTWSNILHHWGIQDLAASLLEATDSLNFLAAQMLYLSQPLLVGILPNDHLNALTALFEDKAQRQNFIYILRDEVSS